MERAAGHEAGQPGIKHAIRLSQLSNGHGCIAQCYARSIVELPANTENFASVSMP